MDDQITFVTHMYWGCTPGGDEDNKAIKNAIKSRIEYTTQILYCIGFTQTSVAIEYKSEGATIIMRFSTARNDGAADFYKPRIVRVGNGKTYINITGLNHVDVYGEMELT